VVLPIEIGMNDRANLLHADDKLSKNLVAPPTIPPGNVTMGVF
jgi:hypothetical protein